MSDLKTLFNRYAEEAQNSHARAAVMSCNVRLWEEFRKPAQSPDDFVRGLTAAFQNAVSVLQAAKGSFYSVDGTSVDRDDLYGDVYSAYTEDEYFNEGQRLFLERFNKNGIDPKDVFAGKNVLDAGCGAGRYTFCILKSGAKKIDAFDLSEKALVSAKATLKPHDPEGRITFSVGSITEIKAADETYDAVWCNSVVHVANDYVKALREITRVLKPGGTLFLYVNGNFGLYADFVRCLYAASKNVPQNLLRHYLDALGYSRGMASVLVATTKVPYQFKPFEEVQKLLQEFGYSSVNRFTEGADGDFISKTKDPVGLLKYGEAELRMLCVK